MKSTVFSLGLVSIMIVFWIQNAIAQVPETFNYQVVVRDGSNSPIANRAVKFRVSLQNDNGSTVYYTETHSATTSSLGLINLNIGGGSIVTGTIKGVPWKTGSVYIKVEIDPNGGSTFTLMGTSKLQAVPFALYSTSSKEILSEATALDDDPIFVVKNKAGKIVFAVYQTGVRVYTEDTKGEKGARGGFAVGGLTNQGKAETEYFRITNDSARIWVNSAAAKGARGGFAVGGLTNKATPSNFLALTPENYFIGQESGLQTTTGLYNSFIGYRSGFSNTTGSRNIFLGRYNGYSNIDGSQNIFIGDSTGNSNTSGFANVFVGDRSGINNQSGYWNIFLGRRSGALNTTGYANIIIGDYAGYDNSTGYDNVIIGDWSGTSNTTGTNNIFLGASSGWTNTIGENNTFIGTNSGYSNLDGNYNVFFGQNSGYNNSSGLSNVFLGKSSGYSNDTASYNVFLGTRSGYNNNGWQNVFLGQESGTSNTSGSFNIFTGCLAGYSNNTGNQNVITGAYAGYENTTGSYNTFYGLSSGYSNTTAEQNVFYGQRSGYSTTTGGWNVFIGPRAGYSNTIGYENVFLGNRAGFSNQIGNYNVFIGDKAGYYETGSNKLYIENSDATSTDALVYGDFNTNELRFNAKVGIGTIPSATYELYVLGDAYATIGWYYPSDEKFKTNIAGLENSLQKIKKLRGVSYEWRVKEFPNMKFENGNQIGFIAQETEKIIPEVVRTDDKGFKSVDYSKLTPVIVEAMKEQQKQIDDQKNLIDKLQKENAKLKNDFEALNLKVEKLLMEKKSPMKQPESTDSGGAKKE